MGYTGRTGGLGGKWGYNIEKTERMEEYIHRWREERERNWERESEEGGG